MSLLQQLIADVAIEEPEYNKSRIVSWSVEDNKLKVNCDQDVLLEDYFYIEGDLEVEFASVEFTVNCDCIYHVDSEDVTLGDIVRLSGRELTYNQITDVKVETAASYNEKTLLDNLMFELTDSGPQPSIDMPMPDAVVKFVEL